MKTRHTVGGFFYWGMARNHFNRPRPSVGLKHGMINILIFSIDEKYCKYFQYFA
jgi:hypothetical protein